MDLKMILKLANNESKIIKMLLMELNKKTKMIRNYQKTLILQTIL